MKKKEILLQLLLIALVTAGCWLGGFWGGFIVACLLSLLILLNVGFYLDWKARKNMNAVKRLTDILKAKTDEGTTD